MGSCLLNRVLARVTPGGSLIVLVVWTMAFVAVIAPPEQLMGHAQRIVYVHVAVAWFALMAFVVTAATAIASAWRRNSEWDAWSHAAAEVGWLSCSLTLITGSIWAHQAWGTWWTWDARLTLTLFLWFVFLGYLILRGAIEDHATRARYSAVLGVLGALLVPFIHLSVYLFRTLHPMPIVLKPGHPSLPNSMLATFAMSFVSFALLFVALLRARYRLAERMDALEAEERLRAVGTHGRSPRVAHFRSVPDVPR